MPNRGLHQQAVWLDASRRRATFTVRVLKAEPEPFGERLRPGTAKASRTQAAADHPPSAPEPKTDIPVHLPKLW